MVENIIGSDKLCHYLVAIFACMKVESILAIEKDNVQSIHLVRDSKFWQAWEKSAFYFHRLFRPFKINCRYFKNVSCDMVYLGFPDTLLDTIKSEAQENGYEVTQENETHIVIFGLPDQGLFDDWKRNVLAGKSSAKENTSNVEGSSKPLLNKIPHETLMLAYREIYDYALDICRRSGKFYRNYRFGLGDRLRDESLQALETMQLSIQGFEELNVPLLQKLFVRARIELRILLDLKQLSNEQWIFVNQKIERILELLRLEFCRRTTAEENHLEFSSQLTPSHV